MDGLQSLAGVAGQVQVLGVLTMPGHAAGRSMQSSHVVGEGGGKEFVGHMTSLPSGGRPRYGGPPSTYPRTPRVLAGVAAPLDALQLAPIGKVIGHVLAQALRDEGIPAQFRELCSASLVEH